MRVGIVISSVSACGGGVTTSARRQALSVHELGCNPYVFSFHDDHSERDAPSWAPVPLRLLRFQSPRQFVYSSALLREMLAGSFDILQGHEMWAYPALACLRWQRTTRRPVLVSAHGMLDGWALQNSNWKKRVVGALYTNRLLKGAECLQVNSPEEGRAVRKLGLRTPLAVIPNGIDPPTRGESLTIPAPWEKVPGEPHGRRTLLFLGRIHPKKNIHSLLDAWATARRLQPSAMADWQLAIVGWDQVNYLARLRAMVGARPQAYGDSVAFHEARYGPAKEACYLRADAFVLPTFSEGMPNAVLEAWACGLPALTTEGCNLAVGWERGAAIRIGTEPDDIVPGLLDLVSRSDAERRAIGQAAQELVARDFTWKHIGEQFRETFEWLLGGGAPPSCVGIV